MDSSQQSQEPQSGTEARLLALVTAQLHEEVDRKVKEREDRLFKMLGILTAVLLFIGYSGVKELISSAAIVAVDNSFAKRTAELETPIYLATLATYLAKAEKSGSFSHTERADMMALLERLADLRKKGVTIGNASFFATTIEGLVDAMSSSDNDLYVDRVFDLFPEDCLRVSSIVQTLSQHYGRLMIVQVGEIKADARRRFLMAEKASTTHKIEEFSLIHRALAGFKDANHQPNQDSKEAITRLAELPGEDKTMAWRFLRRYSEGSWTKKQGADGKILSDTATRFIAAYAAELAEAGFGKGSPET